MFNDIYNEECNITKTQCTLLVDCEISSINLGYGRPTHPFCYTISSCSIVVNTIYLVSNIYSFFKRKKSKNQKDQTNHLELLLLVISALEVVISILWMINVRQFPRAIDLHENCDGCKRLSIFFIFFLISDWVTVTLAVSQFKATISNILNTTTKNLIIKICGGFGVAAVFTILTCASDVHGVSPMISCFINPNLHNIGESGRTNFGTVICLIDVLFAAAIEVYILFTFIQILVYLRKNRDDLKMSIFIKYCSPVILYWLQILFLVILYFMDLNDDIDWSDDKDPYYLALKSISWVTTRFYMGLPVFVGLIRLLQFNKIRRSEKKLKDQNKDIIELGGDLDDPILDKLEEIERKKYISNIFISICYCLENSLNFNMENFKITSNNCQKVAKHVVTKSSILANEKSLLSDQRYLRIADNFEFQIEELAPEVFHYMRQKDNIHEKIMLHSFLPDNNDEGIQKNDGGRGGALFLKSFDNQYLMKTINIDEYDLIHNKFLEGLSKHVTENSDSIISRIYGIYSFQSLLGNKIHLMIMRDVFNAFSKEHNIFSKYDLKGSKLNRRITLRGNDLLSSKVLKDTNFEELEQGFNVSKENCQKLKEIIYRDTLMLRDYKIMDYSLLVVKLKLTESETCILFGKNYVNKMKEEKDEEENYEQDEEQEEENNLNEGVIISTLQVEQKNIEIKNDEVHFSENDVEGLKKYLYPSTDLKSAYIIAIIDFFQLYTSKKWLETKFKRLKTQEIEISSMEPNNYFARFNAKMSQYLSFGIRAQFEKIEDEKLFKSVPIYNTDFKEKNNEDIKENTLNRSSI